MKGVDLTFKDFLGKFDDFGKGEWLTVYSNNREDKEESSGFYSALISQARIKKSLEDPSWDLHIGDGFPGYTFYFENGKEIATYLRCSDEGVEPLVIKRGFHGMKDGYWEVSEEFRFYFNLYEDRLNNKFVYIDDNGDDEDVVIITNKEIKIKSRLIKEFLAVKKMILALFFDFNRFSNKKIEDLGIKEYHEVKKGKDFIYSIGARNWDAFLDDSRKAQGFLMGKKLIFGLKDYKPSMFNREKKSYVDFIIGVDDDGKEILYTSNEDELANYFGKNKGKPHYLTPVLFKKEVLIKYYAQPNKYSIEDGYLRCGGLWGLRMDNNSEDFVMAFLGDLGHLSYNEQLYWRTFNLKTKGKMSSVAWSRGFEAQFADPQKSDLYFKYKFPEFQKAWEKKFGWNFFMPLSKADEHYYKSLHLPLTDEQKEFDEQVLSLVKVLIDSLNEEKLAKTIILKMNKEKNLKGIGKLDLFLKTSGVNSPKMIEFLKNLQNLRSSGVAHRKGSEYEKAKRFFSMNDKELSKVFNDILIKSIWVLNTLENRFLKNK